jgi:hypothetical protein
MQWAVAEKVIESVVGLGILVPHIRNVMTTAGITRMYCCKFQAKRTEHTFFIRVPGMLVIQLQRKIHLCYVFRTSVTAHTDSIEMDDQELRKCPFVRRICGSW